MRAANGGNSGNRWLPDTLNYAVPFDPAHPIDTPSGLDLANNADALQFLGAAVQSLNDAGIALDARLGDLQSVTRNGERIEIHGGPEMNGVYNKIEARYEGAAGYPEVTGSSSSWIMATKFTDGGPVNRGILTYSISSNPNSPHFSDFTERFSAKEWVPLPYRMGDVHRLAESMDLVGEGFLDCFRDGWQGFTTLSFSNQGECVRYFISLR